MIRDLSISTALTNARGAAIQDSNRMAFLRRRCDLERPQHNSITETKWLKRPYFSLENLPIACYKVNYVAREDALGYYLHFPPQLSPFSLISLSSLSYAEAS
jgi:hypothetical protein